jgi:hypothetical protein
VEVKLHALFSQNYMKVSGQLHTPTIVHHGYSLHNHKKWGLMGPGVGLDMMAKWQRSTNAENQTPVIRTDRKAPLQLDHPRSINKCPWFNNILPGGVQWRCSNAVHETSQCGDISYYLSCFQIASNQLSVLSSCPHNMWWHHVLFAFFIAKFCERIRTNLNNALSPSETLHSKLPL